MNLQPPPTNPRRRGLVPPEVLDLVVPPLKFGGWCGAAGAFTGIGAAIIKDAKPGVSGIMTGTQWAALGTTYWFVRRVVIKGYGGEDQMTPMKKVTASAIAGLPAGALMGVASKTRAIPSSMIFCGLFTASGQVITNFIASRPEIPDDEKVGWMGSKFSPLTKLKDEEYIGMMEEKMLRVEADIALIDERIAKLREEEHKGHSK